MEKKYIIFGSGKNGREVYRHLKKDMVAFFCDNNSEKVGLTIDGKEIISFGRLLEIHQDYVIILSVGNKFNVRRQFEQNNIQEYIEYQDDAVKEDMVPNDSLQRIMKADSSMNRLLDQYLDRCKTMDVLNDFAGFKELVKELKQELKGEYAFYESAYNESMLYGHARTLMDYAGIDRDYANFPIMAHGVIYAGTHPDYQTAAIFSGEYDKQIHNSRYPYIPIFSVGPYIQYAKTIYSEETLHNVKKNNGKTAVFFMTHSAEQSYVSYNEDKLLKQITDVYSKEYDTILVCAYWCDIDREIYSRLAKVRGVKIVSAGLRFDTKFIQRLRTIFELGDTIYVYGFTSAIAYALALKKNLFVIDCGEEYDFNNTPRYMESVRFEETADYEYITKVLFRFENKNVILTEEEKNKFDLYFGLNICRTPAEIRRMYQVCCDIWDNCEHLEKDYPIGVYKTYQQYQKNYDFEKLYTLTQSLGKGFWNI
ncbi:MAG: hypothetical protein HFH87_08200 [Lachnospiraceae bacterium]|nr:hypothetical protein [Lachnospiraceae bacterium]